MEVKKLFALASVTALTGFVATGFTAACSSTEVVTIPSEAGTSSGSTADAGKKNNGKSSSGGDDDDSTGDDDDVVEDDDDDTTAEPTCLNKDPIDATKYPYVHVAPGQKAACDQAQLTAISTYYKDNASALDLEGWKASVTEKCAACVFTETSEEEPAAAWGPMVFTKSDDGISFDVNTGGCIEAVSGKEACGRAFQQYQQCTLDACLKDCKDSAGFQKCRQDPAVQTTSCKDAVEAVKTECGDKINKYQTSCKGTSYTFEGPIKVLCITGTGAVADAGADAKTP